MYNWRKKIALAATVASLSLQGTHIPDPAVWITVFVHGIMIVKPYFVIGNTFQLMTDTMKNTNYAATLDRMRHDPFFYQNQAMQHYGLHKIDLTVCPGNASGALAVAYNAITAMTHQEATINHYYTFGWAALLSHTQRVADAHIFYDQLKTEIAQFTKQGITPHIRLLGYSHGGNVCLNLATVRRERDEELPFVIDELILLGTPVQAETDFLTHDALFTTIYHLYSKGDRLQQLDCFSSKRFFSKRVFYNHAHFCIPPKLRQIELKVTRDKKPHTHKKLSCNFENSRVLSTHVPYLRKSAPGHTELWFFAWTPQHYRDYFPLNPLPVAALVPLIIHEAKKFENMYGKSPHSIDLRPMQGIIIAKNKRQKDIAISSCLDIALFDEIRNTVWQYAPLDYSKKIYDTHVFDAYNQVTTR